MQEVLNGGSGSLIQPRLSTKTNFPVAAKTGTNDTNGSTWVVGYTTGLATAAWFGDPLGDQSRPGRNLTVNGKFYQAIDGYMIAGPMFSKYMAQVAPAYGTNPFTAPPTNMVNGTPARTHAALRRPRRPPRRQPSSQPSTDPAPRQQREEGLATDGSQPCIGQPRPEHRARLCRHRRRRRRGRARRLRVRAVGEEPVCPARGNPAHPPCRPGSRSASCT